MSASAVDELPVLGARTPEIEAPKTIRPLTVRRTARLSAARIREADAAIDSAVASLPTAEERRACRGLAEGHYP
jgi:hypothetical protein